MWGNYVYLLWLSLASWEDYRTKQISRRLLFAGSVVGIGICAAERKSWADVLCSCSVGLILLILSYGTRGAIGEGDGLFFVVSGLFFTWRENIQLLMWGMMFCFIWSLPLAVKSAWNHGEGRKRTLPFLPFLLPAAIWMLMTAG